jgi:hypothetical protein
MVTKLDHEVEEYVSATGEVVSWVKIPFLSSSVDTVVYLYYGNPTAADQSNAAGVWDVNYKGVWHLKEDQSGTGMVDLYLDSTANDNHGDDYVSATGQAGKIGAGQQFDGLDDYIDCGNKSNLDVNYITIELWLNINNWVSDGGILAKGDNTYRQYWIWTYNSAGSFEVDEGTHRNNAWNPAAGQWEHLVLTYDGSNVVTYRNGNQENIYPQATGPIDATVQPLLFGTIPSFNYLDGNLDEVRISDIVRSSNWFLTEYNNQSNASGSITTGAQTTTPFPSIQGWSLASDLSYVDVTFSEGMYSTSGGSGPLTASDFTLTFNQNGGTATAASISSVTKTNGSALTGGETVVRVHLSITGTPSGVETIEIRPFDAEGLSGYWRLDATSGATAYDSSGNGSNGTVNGATVGVAGGPPGLSYYFDGIDDNVSMGNSVCNFNDTDPLSIALWVKGLGSATGDMLVSNLGTLNQGYNLVLWENAGADHGQIAVGFAGTLGWIRVDTSVTVADNTWHHVVMTYDGSGASTGVKLYVDGVYDSVPVTVNAGPQGDMSNSTTGPFNIGDGGMGAGYETEGNIAQVRVYNKVLSASEVDDLYQDGGAIFDVSGNAVLPKSSTGLISLVVPDWYDGAWGYRIKITIDHTKVAGDLTDFPYLVHIPTSVSIAANARSDGYDLLFTDYDQVTKLDHEIEKYASSTGELIAWVRVPYLSSSVDTVLYLYYGNPSSVDQSNDSGVWDTNYKAVMHLSEAVTDNATAVGAHADSTLNDNDGDQYNNSPVTGKIADAQDFEGDIRDEYIEIPNSATLENIQEDDYTIEAWFNADQVPPGVEPAYDADYGIVIRQGYHSGLFYNFNGSFPMGHYLTGNVWEGADSGSVFSAGAWHHLVGVVSRTFGFTKVYINGVLEDTNPFTAGSTAKDYGTLPFRIGIAFAGRTDWAWPADGKIDEVRISNTARSDAYALQQPVRCRRRNQYWGG